MLSSAGVIAMGKGADVGVGRKTARKRAVGTREHIIAYLSEADELFDANGMASTQLAAAIGYPGSSVAFAQLLSGMERSGLIEREVRGKRTYRISLGLTHAAGAGRAARVPSGIAASGVAGGARGAGASAAGASAAGVVGGGAGPGDLGDETGTAGFDYDELARRLLVQVVRRLAAADPEASPRDRSAPEGSAADRSAADRSAADRSAADRSAADRSAADRSALDRSALKETVTGLEYELAAAWVKHGKLAEENVRLREQLKAAQRSLALAAERVRRLPVSTDLDSSEVVLLQRLLASGGAESPDDSGQEGLADAPSLLG
jgi:hypothetical protein